MDAAVWGAFSALSFGTADFIARFTGRRFGAAKAVLWVLIVGMLPMIALLLWTRSPIAVSGPASAGTVVVYGLATALATALLYEALARGPVTVVAPIVGAYPAYVVALALIAGRNPGLAALAATTAVLLGAFLTARFAEEHAGQAVLTRSTLVIALGASLSYAGLVITGQAVVPVFGDAQTALAGRMVAITAILLYLWWRPLADPATAGTGLWTLLAVQGLLDGGAYLLLFLGSHGSNPEIAAVAGSCFGAVTTLLAYFILRERVTLPQWAGIVLVFTGVATLSLTA